MGRPPRFGSLGLMFHDFYYATKIGEEALRSSANARPATVEDLSEYFDPSVPSGCPGCPCRLPADTNAWKEMM